MRRTLAGFLLDDELCRTQRWTDRVLVDDDERRLTQWMIGHLLETLCKYATPRDVEQAIIQSLCPPLNVQHAYVPARELIQAARPHYYVNAGPRTSA